MGKETISVTAKKQVWFVCRNWTVLSVHDSNEDAIKQCTEMDWVAGTYMKINRKSFRYRWEAFKFKCTEFIARVFNIHLDW